MTGIYKQAIRVWAGGLSKISMAVLIGILPLDVMAVGNGDFAAGETAYTNTTYRAGIPTGCVAGGCHAGNSPNINPPNRWILAGNRITAKNLRDRVNENDVMKFFALEAQQAALDEKISADIACFLQEGNGSGIDCDKAVTLVGPISPIKHASPQLTVDVPNGLVAGEEIILERRIQGTDTWVQVQGAVTTVPQTITDSTPLPPEKFATYEYRATLRNTDLSNSKVSDILTLFVDLRVSSGAQITGIEGPQGTFNGLVFIKTNTPLLRGVAASPNTGVKVRIYRDNVAVFSEVDGSVESWTYQDTLPDVGQTAKPDGTYRYQASRLEPDGNGGFNESALSQEFVLVVDTTPPAQTTTLAARDDIDNILLVTGDATIDTSPVFSGILSAPLAPEESLHLFRNGSDLGSVSLSGVNWTFQESGLARGVSYSYTARVVDAAGNLGPESGPFTLSIIAPVSVNITGRVTLADGTPCREVDPFFNTDVRTTQVVALDSSGRELASVKTTAFGPGGEFQVFSREGKAPEKLRATCEGTVNGVAVNETAEAPVTGSGPLQIVFGNSRPVIAETAINFPASSNVKVTGVPPGSTVRAEVTVADPDGDALGHRWQGNVESDAIDLIDRPNAVRWSIPEGKGLQTLYFQVSDGKVGGVATGPVGMKKLKVFPITANTDRGLVQDLGRREPVIGTADLVFGNDKFLAFAIRSGHDVLDTRKGACQYYRKIGVVADCLVDGTPIGAMTFKQWRAASGLDAGKRNRGEVTATYRNRIDLNIARDMHGISLPDANGDEAAFYVCNHLGGPDLVTRGLNEANCVAMDYRRIPGINDGKPFLRALVFGPGGDLRLSVDLDGRGEKFVPGSCATCHGGEKYFDQVGDSGPFQGYPEDGTGLADLGINFLPFDLDNFQFSTFANLSRTAQQAKFRKLNRIVAKTAFTPAGKELIDGWYSKNKSARFFGGFIPPAWQTNGDDQNFYRQVIKPYCRTCHVNLERSGRPDLGFNDPADVANNPGFFSVVCGTRDEEGRLEDVSQFARMPNAANALTLLQNPIDPNNFFARENRGKRALLDYFDVLKARGDGVPAVKNKTLVDPDCNLPWLNETLWGPPSKWQQELNKKIPRKGTE